MPNFPGLVGALNIVYQSRVKRDTINVAAQDCSVPLLP